MLQGSIFAIPREINLFYRAEEHSPWNHQSRFYQLRDALAKFHESTPRPFRLTRPNIQAHLTQPTSSTFTLLHTIYSLCLIVLHRENIPFVPIRCSSPEGPLDEHTLPPQPPMPHNFWGDSARQLFKASRDMMDLVQACQSRGLLAETPIMGFGLYNAALIGVYAMNFPHMDLQGSMSGRGGDPNDATNGQKAARDALEIIGQMRSRLPMATNWFRTIHRLHRYYEKIINDYPDNSRSFGDSPPINGQIQHRPLALREGGPGGAAEGSKLLDKILKEFGNTEDEDVEARYVGDRRRNMSGSSNTLEPPRPPVEPRPADSWTAINSIVNPEDRPSIQHNHSSSAPHRYQDDSQSLRPAQSPSTSYPPYPRSPSSMSPMYANDQRMPYPHSPGTQQPPYHHSPPQPQQKTQSPMQYQSHYSHFPPPSRLSNLLNAPMSNHSPQSQAHPPWLSSLYKALGGHDVAAFVDGRSCEELITVATEKAARSTEKGLGDGNLTVDGWLWEVWGGSNRGGRSAAAA